MNARPGFVLLGSNFAAATMVFGGCGDATQTTAPAPAAIVSVGEVSDIDVSTNVKTVLRRNPVLLRFDIGVATLNGDVRLIGVVDNPAQVNEAIKTARSAAGVHTLHNELTIRE